MPWSYNLFGDVALICFGTSLFLQIKEIVEIARAAKMLRFITQLGWKDLHSFEISGFKCNCQTNCINIIFFF